MKSLLGLLPIAVFVAAYFVRGDFFFATIALMIATTAQVVLTWIFTRKIDRQLWITFALVIVLGGLTVGLHDKSILKWKPTLVSWAFAAVILGAQAFGKNPLRAMLGEQLELPNNAWRHLSYGWSAGFALEGVLNLIVWDNFSEKFWVGYKLWGSLGLTMLFIIATGIYLYINGHLREPEETTTAQTEVPPSS